MNNSISNKIMKIAELKKECLFLQIEAYFEYIHVIVSEYNESHIKQTEKVEQLRWTQNGNIMFSNAASEEFTKDFHILQQQIKDDGILRTLLTTELRNTLKSNKVSIDTKQPWQDWISVIIPELYSQYEHQKLQSLSEKEISKSIKSRI